VIAEGSPADIRNNPEVVRAYLGHSGETKKPGPRKEGTPDGNA